MADDDWTAVAKALTARMTDLDLRQKDVADRSGVSLAIIREIQQDRIRRRRNPRTLEALSIALDWHPEHLAALLNGHRPPARTDAPPSDHQERVLAVLDALLREMRGLRGQVTTLNKRIAAIAETATKR